MKQSHPIIRQGPVTLLAGTAAAGLLEMLRELARLETELNTLDRRLVEGQRLILSLHSQQDYDFDLAEKYELTWLRLKWRYRRVKRRMEELNRLIEPKSEAS